MNNWGVESEILQLVTFKLLKFRVDIFMCKITFCIFVVVVKLCTERYLITTIFNENIFQFVNQRTGGGGGKEALQRDKVPQSLTNVSAKNSSFKKYANIFFFKHCIQFPFSIVSYRLE